METIIKREKYFEKIKPFIGKKLIKVLIGQRRVGKSKLLLQIISYIKEELGVKEEKIIFIDKEDLKWSHIIDYNDLYNQVKNYDYIFIDEIQNIIEWEKCVLSLQNNGKDVYITGSNSNLLSSDLATNLRGRYLNINVYPLDYREFLYFLGLTNNKESFEKYIIFGGLPYLINLPLKEEITGEYLKAIGETIIYKDIIERFNIRNVSVFNKIVEYLALNIGTIFSSTKISNTLNSQKIKLSVTTILGYLDFLKQAFIIEEAKRYKIKGKKLFELKQKYYFTDWGIRNAMVGGYKKIDISQILENIVFMNLKSNGWDLKIGEIDGREVDFVCEKKGKTMYLQISYLLENEETKMREFSSLQKINDSWPKYVITMDEGASGFIDGIEWKNIWEFLLKIE